MPVAQAAAARRQARRQLVVSAGQGFANKPAKSAAGTAPSKKALNLARNLGKDVSVQQQGAGDASDWIEMEDVDFETTFISKPIKPLILRTGRAVCLFKVNGSIYATDANSTAYKYPLADAQILSIKGEPALEVALDGTVYRLKDGKVLSWCPKNTVARKLLGGLKDKSEPVDLPVYPVEVRGSKVFVKFTTATPVAAA